MATPEIPKGGTDPAQAKVGSDGKSIVPGGAQEGGKRSAWMTHVKKTMRAHKGMKLAQVLKMAKKTYKKTMRGGNKGGVAATAGSLTGGRRHRRGKNGSRKH